MTGPADGDPPDRDRAAAFLQKMTDVMNGGALALMCSIGHRTGLFDVMAALDGPATATDIATTAGLHERHVREWLGAMVTGGVVELDAGPGTYLLPPEHAGLLTREAGPLNLTAYCQYVSLLGRVEDEVVEAFRSGGGVSYQHYPGFHALMAETSGQRLDALLLSGMVPLIPDGHERLTAGIDVADVGCGSGRALNILAGAYPASRFTGYDIAPDALATGRAQAAGAGLGNVTFVERDAARLGGEPRYDVVITLDALHDQPRPDAVLAGIHRVLRPGGTYLCVEPLASSRLEENLDLPTGPFLYTISTMHCMMVSLAEEGEGLGAAWGEQEAVARITAAGLTDVSVHHLRGDRSNHYLLATRPE
jgi:SAM-dependent methyltransferase